MDAKKENDILEKTLAIAESGYPEAYQFLMDAYEACPESYGPQTLYFLSCLAGGTDKKTDVLMWLKKAISDCGWWYRPEVLEDDDLGLLKDEQEFLSLKAVSDARYAEAAASSKACFSWMKKTAENLFLAVHGNTQNAETARADWETVLAGKDCWQIETIQSGEPDGYGTYRWSYDETSYLPVAGVWKNHVWRIFCRMRYASSCGYLYVGALRCADAAKPVDSGAAGAFGRIGTGD